MAFVLICCRPTLIGRQPISKSSTWAGLRVFSPKSGSVGGDNSAGGIAVYRVGLRVDTKTRLFCSSVWFFALYWALDIFAGKRAFF